MSLTIACVLVDSQRIDDRSVVDVAVVGLGYAGLVVAKRLTDANITVRAFEALDRPGGRAYDTEIGIDSQGNDILIENGVAFIGTESQQPFASNFVERGVGHGDG